MTVLSRFKLPSFEFTWRPFATTVRRVAAAAMAAAAIAVSTVPAQAQDLAAKFAATGGGTLDHGEWTQLLETYVKPSDDGLNRVDYTAFKASGRDALTAYLSKLTGTDPTTLNRNEQFAFWANLYNAKTIDVVLEHYPVATIRDIDISPGLFSNGPWGKKVVAINGTKLSLDDIEHKILRPHFGDPRVHYAVNCASVGCPNLAARALQGEGLDDQLNAAARAYINSSRGFAISGKRITASKIYKWFQEDFGGSEDGVLKHALIHAEPDLAEKLKSIADIRSFAYDWALNDTNK
ncbi:MAG: DUF547 domain-containing protein [Hyphomicrobiaceae bacterium]